MKTAVSLVVITGLTTAASAYAGDELFDDASLFGGDGLIEQSTIDQVDLAQDFLTAGEPVTVTGSFAVKAKHSIVNAASRAIQTKTKVTAGGVISIGVRPQPAYRLLLKTDYDINQDKASISLREGFVDASFLDKVYTRTGRQTLHWGAGVYYSPADLISSDRVDSRDPEAGRKGTDAIKLHWPQATNNYYVYIIDDQKGHYDVALKGEWLVDSAEVSVGLVSKNDGQNSIALTVAQLEPWGKWYGEYVLHHGVVSDALDANAVASDRSQDLLQQATLGGSYTLSDADDYKISASGQWYYNGLGYSQAHWQNNTSQWLALAAAGTVETYLAGQMYVASSLRWSDMYQTGITASLTHLYSATDGSYSDSLGVSYKFTDELRLSFNLGNTASGKLGQYSPSGPQTSYSLTLSMLNYQF